jgi:hypothetical protein
MPTCTYFVTVQRTSHTNSACGVLFSLTFLLLFFLLSFFSVLLQITVDYFYPLMTSVEFIYTDRLGVSSSSVPLVSGAISNRIAIDVGTSAIRITCIAEDGTTTGVYTLTVNRISNDPSIATLTADPISYVFIPGFVPYYYSYILSVAPNVAIVRLTPTHTYPKATMVFKAFDASDNEVLSMTIKSGTPTPVLPLIVGNNTVRFVSTAEDGFTQVVYSIFINRISTDSSIQSIAFNGYDDSDVLLGAITPMEQPPFHISNLAYNIYLPNGYYGGAFSGVQNYPRADLVWTMSALSMLETAEVYVGKNQLTPVLRIEPGINTLALRCRAQRTESVTCTHTHMRYLRTRFSRSSVVHACIAVGSASFHELCLPSSLQNSHTPCPVLLCLSVCAGSTQFLSPPTMNL